MAEATGARLKLRARLQEIRPGLRAALWRALREAKEDRVPLTAAGVALYWFLSVFPLLFAAVGLLDLLHLSSSLVAGINKAITTALPGDAARLLTQAVTNSQSRADRGGLVVLVAGVVIALWSAASGMAAIQIGLDVAYEVRQDRSWLKRRLVGLVLLGPAFVLAAVAVAGLVFGQPVGVFISKHVPAGGSFVWAWTASRWVITILAVLTLFAVFYYAGPNRTRPRWKWLSAGGVVATLIWLASSAGFSLYVSGVGDSFTRTYGALAGVVILVLWMYLSALALLFGAELNSELEKGASASQSDPPSVRAPGTSGDLGA